jgi:lipopolysaccharide/colanic/teichoic acid biosynthesis glycosyltransferase
MYPGKRIFDLVLGVPLLLLALPVMLFVSLMLLACMGPPVFFVQERPGLGGAPFRLIKFRTMRGGPGSDAERLTAPGRLLRRLSLDELPEIINVLRGQMSLVGPRPLLMQYLPLYSPGQARRHEVPPGITGWAQVNGRNAISWEDKFRLDVWYVDHASPWLDLRILCMTAWKVISGEGISQAGQATAEPFRGSRS